MRRGDEGGLSHLRSQGCQTMQSQKTQLKTLQLCVGISRSRLYEDEAATAQMSRQPLWTSPFITPWSSELSSALSIFLSVSLLQ